LKVNQLIYFTKNEIFFIYVYLYKMAKKKGGGLIFYNDPDDGPRVIVLLIFFLGLSAFLTYYIFVVIAKQKIKI
jgi:hypothetical protein